MNAIIEFSFHRVELLNNTPSLQLNVMVIADNDHQIIKQIPVQLVFSDFKIRKIEIWGHKTQNAENNECSFIINTIYFAPELEKAFCFTQIFVVQ